VIEHFSKQLVERYYKNALDPDEWLALDDHLAVCEDCRAKLQETVPVKETLLTLQASMRAEPQTRKPSFWRRFLAFIGLTTLRDRSAQDGMAIKLTPWLAMAAVMALLIVLALQLRGRINVRDLGKTPTAPVTSPSPDPSVKPSPEPLPQILLALNDGGAQVTLDAQGKLTGLESTPPADRQRIKTALISQKIESPEMLKELEVASGAAMGGSSNKSFKLISQIGRIVADDRPTLRWQPLEGALSYQVTITDPKANYKVVAVSSALPNTKWRVERPLVRGRVYAWQVIAHTNSGDVIAPPRDAPEARFGVLGEKKMEELARAKRDYAGRHLALGLLYAQAGLLDDAEREFQALIAANREAAVAKNLLREVRSKRRAR
jgi:hypothetical protein